MLLILSHHGAALVLRTEVEGEGRVGGALPGLAVPGGAQRRDQDAVRPRLRGLREELVGVHVHRRRLRHVA